MNSVIIVCSDCNAPLVQVYARDMSSEPRTNYVAQCPHCGDKSFWQEAPIDVMIGDTEYTSHVNTLDNDDHYELVTKSVKKYNHR